MQFNMEHTGKKRQMILQPEVNPISLLLFFERGNSGASWSIRDYSVPNRVSDCLIGVVTMIGNQGEPDD